MKVTVDEHTKGRPEKYPRLMKSDQGMIVLFSEHQTGTFVRGEFYNVGHYSENWVMSEFTDFHGTITLEND